MPSTGWVSVLLVSLLAPCASDPVAGPDLGRNDAGASDSGTSDAGLDSGIRDGGPYLRGEPESWDCPYDPDNPPRLEFRPGGPSYDGFGSWTIGVCNVGGCPPDGTYDLDGDLESNYLRRGEETTGGSAFRLHWAIRGSTESTDDPSDYLNYMDYPNSYELGYVVPFPGYCRGTLGVDCSFGAGSNCYPSEFETDPLPVDIELMYPLCYPDVYSCREPVDVRTFTPYR